MICCRAVYLVRHKQTKERYALKKLNKHNLALRNEIKQVEIFFRFQELTFSFWLLLKSRGVSFDVLVEISYFLLLKPLFVENHFSLTTRYDNVSRLLLTDTALK